MTWAPLAGSPICTRSGAGARSSPMTEPRPAPVLQRFALGLLGYSLLVVLWGAYVRASFSGDGCGDHWPTCNGEIIPRARTVQTLIELKALLEAVSQSPSRLEQPIAGWP